MDLYTHLLQVELILLVGVTSVLMGFLLLVLDRRWRKKYGKKMAGVFLAILIGGVVATFVAGQQTIALGLSILTVVWTIGWLLRLSNSVNLFRSMGNVLGGHHLQAVVLVLLGFGSLLGWGYWQTAALPEWHEEEDQFAETPPPMQLADVSATTDRGNLIPVRVVTSRDPALCPIEAEKKFLNNAKLTLRIIRTGMPSLETNCHGWVFTTGRYWILGEDVPKILEENGYEAVTQPRTGDVIVYRDSVDHRILHTGIVNAVAPDGRILIESKWGKMGRFLHMPEDQRYSPTWQYYRSARNGHEIKNLPPQSNPAPATTTTAKNVS